MLTRRWTTAPCASDSVTFQQRPGNLGGGEGGAEIAVAVSLFFEVSGKVLGSIPSGGSCASHQPSYRICIARLLPAELIPLQHLSVPTDMPKSLPARPYPMRQDSLAERSKAADVESRNLECLCHCSTASRSCSLLRPRQLMMVCLSIKRHGKPNNHPHPYNHNV